ncbi:MAG: sigma-70 family RNA polymerase sigma factor [Phycisphaerales bacterium]|nr:sigma-70 family RNA polymerase sigma factor [Phycisphaerales bacterium]
MARFSGLVWSIARKLSADPSDAEDAVQEVFIDLWRSAHRFDPAKGTETTFVATIARRRLIDRGRRRQRRPEVPGIDDGVAATAPSREDPDVRERLFLQPEGEMMAVLDVLEPVGGGLR